jgi:hypothetical protein
MDWNQWLRILRWRALEEGDADGALLSVERRAEATARTRAGLTSEAIGEGGLSGREQAFLQKRADWLEHEVIGWSGSLVRLMERLVVVSGRWSWAFAGWIGAIIIGYAAAGLGQEAEFNLLALPLVAVLVWNAVVMAAALIMELKPAPSQARTGAFAEWLQRRLEAAGREAPQRDGDVITGVTVDQRFRLLAAPLAAERLYRRMRAWFHVAAALLALGSAAGLYARGWSREYRAVWESTLLNEAQAESFFGGLFAPASAAFRLEVPLDKLPGMHRSGGVAAAPAPALPWIHLYAGTLVLLVVAPRLALAGLTLMRGRMILQRRVRALGWRPYLVRLLRAVEGGHEKVTVLVHGAEPSPTHVEVWMRGVRERYGGMLEPELVHVPLGDEDEFAASWAPANPRVVIIFNLATTPEAEVQRRLVADVRRSLHARQQDAELLVLLDATSIGNRWPPEKMSSREQLWTEMLEGVADDVMIAMRRGGEASARLPV